MANDLGQMVVRIVGDNTGLDKSIDSSEAKFKKFGESASKIGTTLSLGVTAPLVAMFGAAVKSSASMEMLQASFETMLGSATKATSLMAQLKEMAAVTPFETEDLAQASKTLLQFGVSADKLIPTLKMLGDASGGNSAKFNSMALVFGQISSAGKLMGQDLLQLINVGFNPLKEISDRTGESMASLKDRMSKGGISADDVAKSFEAATSKGGLFFNGMETASKTLSGLTSTLKDDVATLGRSFVEDLMPVIKSTVKDLSALAQKFTALSPETKKMIFDMLAFAAAVGPVIIVAKKANDTFGDMKNIFAGLATKNGLIGLAVAGVIALGVGFAKLIQSAAETKTALLEIERISKGGKVEDPAAALKLVNTQLEKQRKILADMKSGQGRTAEQVAAQKQLVAEQEAVVNNLKATQKLLIDNATYEAMNARGAALTAAEKEKEAENNKAIALTLDQINEKEKERKRIEDEIKGVIEDNKTEYEQLEEQIQSYLLLDTAASKIAIEILRERQAVIRETSNQVDDAAQAEYDAAWEVAQARIQLTNEAYDAQVELNKSANEGTKAFTIFGDSMKEAIDDAIDNLKSYASQVLSFAADLAGAFIDAAQASFDKRSAFETKLFDITSKNEEMLLTERLKNEEEAANKLLKQKQKQLDDDYKLEDAAAKKTLKLKQKTLDDEAKAAKKTADKKLDSELSTLDTAEQEKLYSLGLVGAATLEQYDAEIAAAIAKGDTETATALKKERDTLAIELDFAAKKQEAIEKAAKEEEARNVAFELRRQTLLDEAEKKDELREEAFAKKQQKLLDDAAEAEEKRIAEKTALEAKQAADKLILDKKMAQEGYKITLAQFNINKAFSIAAIAIDTAAAVVKALPNVVLAAIVGAAGIAQGVIVAAKSPPSPPSFANGGIVMPSSGGTLAQVAEAGQPEVIFPLDKLQQFLGNQGTPTSTMGDSGDIHLIVNLDSKPFLDKIFPATKNRTILISAGAVV